MVYVRCPANRHMNSVLRIIVEWIYDWTIGSSARHGKSRLLREEAGNSLSTKWCRVLRVEGMWSSKTRASVKASKDMKRNEGLVFGTGATTGSTQWAQYIGVVIGSGPTGKNGAPTQVTQLSSTALTGAGAGAEAWFFLSKSNARTISLSSANIRNDTARVEEVRTYLGKQLP
ncbi:hypothetical protein Tco_1016037 [Tanacetum coccineum]|uniref:Uncharacterized protein n=1 Tax=Tanacetum coccineum TaxID=301880 RepID=A0ABQ5FPD3_9ASTR